MQYKVYTDGSCKGGEYGGWAYVIIPEGSLEQILDAGAQPNTTNQQMELYAAIRALSYFQGEEELAANDTVEIYTDSAYLSNCINQKWWVNWEANGWKNAKKQPVANRTFWELLIPYFKDNRISWHKVEGHAGVAFNELVDKAAQAKALELKSRAGAHKWEE